MDNQPCDYQDSGETEHEGCKDLYTTITQPAAGLDDILKEAQMQPSKASKLYYSGVIEFYPVAIVERDQPRMLRLKIAFNVFSSLRGWVQQEGRKMIKLATPIVNLTVRFDPLKLFNLYAYIMQFLALALQQTQLIVSMLYVGHVTGSSLVLDAIGLAVSVCE